MIDSPRVQPWLMVGPGLLFLLATVVYPLLFALVIAFKDYDIGAGLAIFGLPWIGWDNFAAVLSDPVFASAIRTTLTIAITALGVQAVLGMALALAIDALFRDRADRLYTTLILTPLLLTPIAGALIWRTLLNPQYGFLMSALALVGLPGRDLLGDPFWAVVAVIVVDVWQWTPFVFLIFLAGLRAIPEDLREAAAIDGASWWQAFGRLVLPLMIWPILLVTLIRGTDLLRTFDYVFGLTFGGPGYATETVSFYAYLTGFKNFNLGEGAAAAWLIFLAIYGLALALLATRPAREAWA